MSGVSLVQFRFSLLGRRLFTHVVASEHQPVREIVACLIALVCVCVVGAIQVDPQVYADYFKKSKLKKDSMHEVR